MAVLVEVTGSAVTRFHNLQTDVDQGIAVDNDGVGNPTADRRIELHPIFEALVTAEIRSSERIGMILWSP